MSVHFHLTFGRNPLRVCGLSDMDAFYAACEQIRLGLDPSARYS